MRNPYVISFGRIPTQYISRRVLISDIIDALESDIIEEQAYKLTGVRGTGKTVTLTEIEKKIRENDNWIVVGVKSNGNIIEDIIANLYSSVPFLTSFVDANLNLTKFGIGLNLSNKSPVASLDYALKTILREVDRKGMRVLITIDEARKTKHMVDFIQEFQILIREELPVFLIAAGLYEDVESIENAEGLTFFLRAAKYEMTPLNHTFIRNDYEKTLNVSREVAEKMATITKGYAFAYQALGKYMWDLNAQDITEEVLALLDETLAEKVYRKIWSELAPRDKWFLEYIVKKDKMSATELLEMTNKKHNEWSEPRKRLTEKGIIDTKIRGQIIVCLPRLKEFVENETE
ncbi:MAG: hypothetical protein MSA91_09990 [Lachnobacterium sp.]|nr:hypothetical protein [Lachnobacterium sp.]MDD6631556.1 hypothetical protein [Lachnobacterium sp.]